ncbi:4'-phosphopantetheinyl transferase family protein [Paenibacillus typhae]|uniref:4'-phosphopantetheinyl transferase n=1 Tax=Paenibacillus typhae TaxID=1174501 RepID=A0A1G8F8S0_9BACL|nr:4'-phosphopantetheinyl transferase superfamily protein [Paenibacillus typhae]SDH78507.1 4'-phosphopantetheinyl transferase [Paenibacillus typhae]
MEILAVRLKFHEEQESTKNFKEILKGIDPNIRQKIHKFHRYEDKLRSLCGEMLLQIFSYYYWNFPRKSIMREVNSYGKPVFANYPEHHFNISHSGDWVVAAFDNSPVGIDIEKIVPIDLEISKSFFASSELNVIQMRNNKQEQIKLFYQIWTLKESYVKAIGKGLSIPLNSFAIDFSNGKPVILQKSKSDFFMWNLMQYNLNNEYALSVCSQNPNFPKQIRLLEWEELNQYFAKINSNC